jgi:hypothetical protein
MHQCALCAAHRPALLSLGLVQDWEPEGAFAGYAYSFSFRGTVDTRQEVWREANRGAGYGNVDAAQWAKVIAAIGSMPLNPAGNKRKLRANGALGMPSLGAEGLRPGMQRVN